MMRPLTFPTMSVIAQALVAHRATGAKALADWESSSEKGNALSAEVVAHCRLQLAAIDTALIELQSAAPPFISDFLKHQINLSQNAAPTTPPSNQEAP